MTQAQKTSKFQKIKDKIEAAKNIAVFTHINHDPDGLGSLFGISRFLESQGKHVDKFLDSEIGDIDGRFFDRNEIKDELDPKKYDLMIMVDNATAVRLGKYCTAFKDFKNTIRIDHHQHIFKDAKIELTLPYTSACEVILEFIEFCGAKPDKKTAEYLYAGLLTDTDSFMIDTVNASTFNNALKLMEYGADHARVSEMIYRPQTLPNLKVFAKMIEKTEIFGDVAISCLLKRDFKEAGLKDTNTGNIAFKLASIDGVNFGCLIKQTDNNLFACSFRCKKGYDVSKIAAHFGGGGHKQAAACRNVRGNEKHVKALILNAIKELR